MKNLILILLLFNIALFCQSELSEEQIIQSTIGQDKITMLVLDFATDEPLIGAIIYSRDLKDTLSTTNIDGNASFQKGVSENFQISYIGYEYLCFQINDNNIDNIIVRLKIEISRFFGLIVYSFNIDSLEKAGRLDAENDFNAGKIQLLYKIEPTEEQRTFAKKYSFRFVTKKSKTIDYRQSYNEVILGLLSDKFNVNIRKELRTICWTNTK